METAYVLVLILSMGATQQFRYDNYAACDNAANKISEAYTSVHGSKPSAFCIPAHIPVKADPPHKPNFNHPR